MIDKATKRRAYVELHARFNSSVIDYAFEGIRRSDDGYWPRHPSLDFGPPPKVECNLHRIVLTGPYGYSEVAKLGRLKVGKGRIRRKYLRKSILNIRGFRLSIFTWPTNYRPPCCIEIVPLRHVEPREYKKMLIKLWDILPGLTVSEVEYAVDVYCRSADDVANLFREIIRYLWVPRKSRVSLPREQKCSDGERMNYVYHIRSQGSKIKAYERGLDSKRFGKGWPFRAIVMVRLEKTVGRAELRRHGIYGLHSLIRHPLFAEINDDVYRFSRFQGSRRLPNPWDEYALKMAVGELTTPFQAEYLYRKGLEPDRPDYVKNLAQYRVPVLDFAPFTAILINQMKDFDREWTMA